MKKTVIAAVLLSVLCGVVIAADADNVMKKVFNNIDKITSGDVNVTVVSKEDKAGKSTEKSEKKRVRFKSPDKLKITYEKTAALKLQSAGVPESAEPENEIVSNKNPYLSPACIFNAKKFFSGYEFRTLEKDERIKRGREEIIAVRKGQAAEYPQIRLVIKNDIIESVRFYSAAGKRYYEVVAVEHKKNKGINVPVLLKETVTAEGNTTETVLDYRDIQVNVSIPDAEFVK